jgi:5-methylcytosine-specific restriction endonuclease McrA
VARALILLWKDAARVVDVRDYQTFTWEDWAKLSPAAGDAFLRATNCRLRVPEVIALTEYDRLPTQAVTFSRRNIY